MTSIPSLAGWYRGKRVVITGGLGFIGSNLALELWRMGGQVTVIDSLLEGCGGNLANLATAQRQIAVVHGDIADTNLVAGPLLQADVIFNLAGEVSHTHSMLLPDRDLRVNTLAHLRFLEACALFAPSRRVVYAGTRQVYGTPKYLPVTEEHPTEPPDFNGVHKLATEQYHLLLTRLRRIDAVVLRLTNVYGPRQAIGHCCQGVLAVFFQRAMQGMPLTVFGDGTQLRDPIYVDDACEALLRAGAVPEPAHRLINIGSASSISLFEIAAEIARQADLPKPVLRDFPPERAEIDIGSYASSEVRSRAILGWSSRTALREGVRRTLAYYMEHQSQYMDGPALSHCCALKHAGTATAIPR